MDIKELKELKEELNNGLSNNNEMSLKTLKDIIKKVISVIDLIILNEFESDDNEQIESLKNLLEIEKKEVNEYARGIDELQKFIDCMLEDLEGDNNNSDFKSGMIYILKLITRQLNNI